MLLEKGADVNVVNDSRKSALDICRRGRSGGGQIKELISKHITASTIGEGLERQDDRKNAGNGNT